MLVGILMDADDLWMLMFVFVGLQRFSIEGFRFVFFRCRWSSFVPRGTVRFGLL